MNNKNWLQLLADASIIVKKRIALDRCETFLANVSDLLVAEPHFNAWVKQFPESKTKISRGENYKGMPWRLLDCPAWFSKEHQAAFRFVIVWGKGLSMQCLLRGMPTEKLNMKIFLDKLPGNLGLFSSNEAFNYFPEPYERQMPNAALEAEKTFLNLIKVEPFMAFNEWETKCLQFFRLISKAYLQASENK